MEGLVKGLDVLAGEDVRGLPDEVLRDQLVELLAAVHRLHAQVVARVAEVDDRGLCVGDGCRSTGAWLRSFGRLSVFGAGQLVGAARVLRDLPLLAQAHAAGEVSGEHVRQVANLVKRVGVPRVVEVEEVLTGAAMSLDPNDFSVVCARVRAQADPGGDASEAKECFDRRGLTLSHCDGVVLVRGQLDPQGGATVSAAVEALLTRAEPGDTRTRPQRMADAFVQLCDQALKGGGLPTVGGVRPQVGVIVSPEDLITTDPGPDAGEPEPGEPGEPGDPGEPVADLRVPGRPAPWLNWVGETYRGVARRIACDADVWRIVLDPVNGRPTDVGRAHRLVPAWQRKALVARDRGCRFPNCRAPADWTDAHHLRHWADGGPTDMDNLILLCRFHHVLVHEGGWRVHLDPRTGEVSADRPDGDPYDVPDHRSRWSIDLRRIRARGPRAA